MVYTSAKMLLDSDEVRDAYVIDYDKSSGSIYIMDEEIDFTVFEDGVVFTLYSFRISLKEEFTLNRMSDAINKLLFQYREDLSTKVDEYKTTINKIDKYLSKIPCPQIKEFLSGLKEQPESLKFINTGLASFKYKGHSYSLSHYVNKKSLGLSLDQHHGTHMFADCSNDSDVEIDKCKMMVQQSYMRRIAELLETSSKLNS